MAIIPVNYTRRSSQIGDIEATLFHSEFDREAIQDVYSLRRNLRSGCVTSLSQ